ncbi:hypothetical protein PMSD_11265 [Paenibacillus macquariensis subsp. defensor]|nr:hypothetical protein PMSD_11265 [Paenibacillus macquariensis subsp. defensor]
MSPFNLDMELKKGNREVPQQLPDLIRVRQDEIYASLDDIPLRSVVRTGKQKAIRSMLLVISAAVIMGICVIGSGFISPAMADSLKQLPLVSSIFKLAGDLGLKTADEMGLATTVNHSDTHNGVTLSVPQVMYDGTRVSIAIQREAQGMTSNLFGSYVNSEGIVIFEPEGTKGTMKGTKLFIDGKTYGGSGMHWKAGADHNSVIIEFLSNQGPDYSLLPSQFELTLEITLEGIHKPFIMDISVKNTLKNSIVLTPDVTLSHDYVTITLKKVELSPVTTRLAFVLDGTSRKIPEKYRFGGSSMLSLDYDVFDDQGNELKQLSGQGGYAYKDLLYEPLSTTSTFFTIKPYTNVYKDKNAGEYLLDKEGWPIKEYVKELEMKIYVAE